MCYRQRKTEEVTWLQASSHGELARFQARRFVLALLPFSLIRVINLIALRNAKRGLRSLFKSHVIMKGQSRLSLWFYSDINLVPHNAFLFLSLMFHIIFESIDST